MNTPEHRPAMGWPEYRPPTITVEGLLGVIESLPDPPPTHLPRLRRLMWWGADRTRGRLSCVLHDIGWHLP
jgi:hypothetical protein